MKNKAGAALMTMAKASGWPLFAGLGPLGALPTVPRLARAFGGLVLGGWGLGHLAENCELIVSEQAISEHALLGMRLTCESFPTR